MPRLRNTHRVEQVSPRCWWLMRGENAAPSAVIFACKGRNPVGWRTFAAPQRGYTNGPIDAEGTATTFGRAVHEARKRLADR